MRNLFATVKAAVTTREAAETYGLKINRNGMACCPFHEDRHPSLKVDERYYCFGCHETGDVIDYTAKLFGLSLYEAARKLAWDFHVDPNTPVPNVMLNKRAAIVRQQNLEAHCVRVLVNYEKLLKRWQKMYVPSDPEAPYHEKFVKATHTLPAISDLLDCLYSPDAGFRKNTAEALMKDGTIARLEAVLRAAGEEQDHGEAAPAAA